MTNCMVCLDTVVTGPITALICGHVFHHHCIRPWVASHPRCPLCKKSLIQYHPSLMIPLYLDLDGQAVLQDSSTASVSIIPQSRSKDQYKQLQNQLQTTMQKLKSERQQFEKERRQYIDELGCYQNIKNIKGVLELESGLSDRQLLAKIQNWKALPQDQLAKRMGILVQRQKYLSRELNDTEMRLCNSKNHIEQLREQLALSCGNQDGSTLEAPGRLKRKRSSSSSTGNDLSTKKRDKRPAIDLDAGDNTFGEDDAYWTRTASHVTHRSAYIQSGQSSSSSGSGSKSDEYTGSSRVTKQSVKYEMVSSDTTDTPCQQILSIIDSDDETTPTTQTSKAITRNTSSTRHTRHARSTRSARNGRHTRNTRNTIPPEVIVLSDDDELTG